MSEMSTLFHAGLLQYLVSHTQPEPDFMKELREAGHQAGFPPIAIAPEQGAFMQGTVEALWSAGRTRRWYLVRYSALTMAATVGDDGFVDTVDVDPKSVAFSREWFDTSVYSDRINSVPLRRWLLCRANQTIVMMPFLLTLIRNTTSLTCKKAYVYYALVGY